MTTDLPHTHPTEEDIGREPIEGPVSGSHSQSAVSPSPAPDAPNLPVRPALPYAAPDVPVLPAAPVDPAHRGDAAPPETWRFDPPAGPPVDPPVDPPAAPPTAPAEPGEEARAVPEVPDQHETGDEAVHTLLTTAATERPVNEVAALVARLQETGELSSPADVALRAAAVTRPLDEVRELLALLNASGYELHQAETTLRAAAVGRPIEDVVRLVGILGTDSSDWQPTEHGNTAEWKAGSAGEPAPAPAGPQRSRDAAKRTGASLDGALAAGPGSHSSSPALRSALRWPAALALLACGLVHLPTDLTGLRAGGDTETLSVVVTVLCLVGGVWLAARDTLVAWAAAAGLGVAVIALHGVASARTVDLLSGSLGATSAWAKAVALLGAVAVVALAASVVVRHTRAAGTAGNA
ncbi:hypothetical protein [Streptomyces bikiniensis]|uniref:hypothetical protein n=1 Tax=Streptomyces bikiniensis TaxID=1896 RepID=UPI000ABB6A5F|nr:hypothetical protein [Streptomyces bikiniensis]